MLPHEDQVDVSYRQLIEEAYISPIRSAVLVDDDFPTLEDLVNEDKVNKKGTATLRNLLETCRKSPNHWLIDVNDGRNIGTSPSAEDYRHLHHSDLMVLDYHLDGSDGDNKKALGILRTLANNDYFNIVVVYTACHGMDDLQSRMKEIVCGLTFQSKMSESPSIPEKIQQIEDGVNDQYSDDDFVSKLRKLFLEISPIHLLEGKDDIESKWMASSIFSQIKGELERMNLKAKSDQREILTWLWNDRLYTKKEFSTTDLGAISYSNPDDAIGKNWIKSDRLFVTIIEKSTPPSEIRNKLLDALAASNPSPYQLLMAKMRNSLDEKGFIAESAIVRKNNIQAGLLCKVLDAESEMIFWELSQVIGYHWEQLSAEIEGDIHYFGAKLFNCVRGEIDENNTRNKLVEKYTSTKVNNNVENEVINMEVNSFICSKKPSGVHLAPGQIFAISGYFHEEAADNVENEKSYWMCFSPACNLVPGQQAKKWKKAKFMPFTAVKLWEVKSKDAIKKINTNDYIFVEIEGEVIVFGFTKDGNSNPVWEQYFSPRNGMITDGTFKLSGINRFDEVTELMEIKTFDANIVAQLRYEYAINLMQKIGANLTRVGLDFIKIGNV